MKRCSSLNNIFLIIFLCFTCNICLLQNSDATTVSRTQHNTNFNKIINKWKVTKLLNNDSYEPDKDERSKRRRRQEKEGGEEEAPPSGTTAAPAGGGGAATTTAAASKAPDTEATTPPAAGGGDTTTALSSVETAVPGGGSGPTNANQNVPAMGVGSVCNTKLFKRLDRCCPTPTLINYNDIQRCVRRSKRSEKSEFYPRPNFLHIHNIIFGRRGGGGGMRNMNSGNMGNNNNGWVAKGARQGPISGNNGTNAGRPVLRTDPTQVCLTDCVFRNLKWVAEDWTVNANMMFATMTALVPPAWGALIATAKTDCAPILGAGVAAMIRNPTTGGFCLQAPTKLMRCIKKTFITSCPTMINSGAQCTQDMNLLKACDIHAI